ncbi:MAG: pimeloyl-ACP methyl ester carboxylesterase [Candidatus Azotimanducaceae bacterium]|jgi:pimeloyl-ACP methyl ester carboxylesterase
MKISVIFLLFLSLRLGAQAAEFESSAAVSTSVGVLHYRMAGSGKPLVLLHGYTGYSHQWQAFLAEFVDDYKVIAIDLPGHGQSSKLGASFIVADAATGVWEVMDHLGVKQIHGVGYSAGGMTLLQMALRQPSRVQAMVLASSAYSVPGAAPRKLFEALPQSYQRDLLRNHGGDMEKIRAMLSANFLADMNIEDLKDLKTPTLLLSGDRDESFPLPVVVETYTALSNARLWIVPGIGHALFWPWGGSEALARQFSPEVLRFFREIE